MENAGALDVVLESKEELQARLEAGLSALLVRQGEHIDAVSFALIDDIARNIALLLAVDVSVVRSNAGISQRLAEAKAETTRWLMHRRNV